MIGLLLSSFMVFITRACLSQNVLFILLCMEGALLSVLVFITCVWCTIWGVAIMLSMVAVEGSVGLAIMVLMSRSYGNDLVTSVALSKG